MVLLLHQLELYYDTDTHTQTDTYSHIHTDTHTDGQIHTQTHTQTQTQTHTQTDTYTQTHTTLTLISFSNAKRPPAKPVLSLALTGIPVVNLATSSLLGL